MIFGSSDLRREGTDASHVSAPVEEAVAALSRPCFVTRALGDLLDQGRSSGVDPVVWVLPPVRAGGRSLRTVLQPRWTVDGTTVRIDAPSTERSDTDVRLLLTTRVTADDRTTLTTSWRVDVVVPVPRAVVQLAGSSLDRSVRAIVSRVTGRVACAINETG